MVTPLPLWVGVPLNPPPDVPDRPARGWCSLSEIDRRAIEEVAEDERIEISTVDHRSTSWSETTDQIYGHLRRR